MRLVKLAALGAALALSGGLLVPSTTAAATQVVAIPAPTLLAELKLDMNGKAGKDTARLYDNHDGSYDVTVTLSGGASDTVTVASTIASDWGIDPWLTAARLDGRKGWELMLPTGGNDGYTFVVLTWRSGNLVREKAPQPRFGTAYVWYTVNVEAARYGYRFTTTDGKRYVRQARLYPVGARWEGTVTRSVWKSGAWHELRTKNVSLTKKQAKPYRGISGVTIIDNA